MTKDTPDDRRQSQPSPSLPPLSVEAVNQVDSVERYMAKVLSECGRNASFNTEKAIRSLRTCVLQSFAAQLKYYLSLKGYTPSWADEIKNSTIKSTIGLIGSRTGPFYANQVEAALRQTLDDFVAPGVIGQVAAPKDPPRAAKGATAVVARKSAIDGFLALILAATGQRVRKQDISLVAGYRERTEFQRFQRNDPRTNKTAVAAFDRTLSLPQGLKLKARGRREIPIPALLTVIFMWASPFRPGLP